MKGIKFLLIGALMINCQLSMVNVSFGQINYQQDYKNAKYFFQQGKYNLAMESYKKLMVYDQENPFSPYASFYYAVSAYRLNYKSIAKDTFSQLKSLYPVWENSDEVNYWLAIILFDLGDSFQALKLLQSIENKSIKADVAKAKQYYLAKIKDAEILRMMLEEFPKDDLIATSLARYLSKNLSSQVSNSELEELIRSHHLTREEFIGDEAKPYFKQSYSVAALFPFVLPKLDPSPTKKPNQFVLDFYLGMNLAIDTLKKQGIKIQLLAYDTERTKDKLKLLLASEELQQVDLLIGPMLREDNVSLQEFSRKYNVKMVNPLANDSDLIKDNPQAFLFQPSYETLGAKSAAYLASDAVNRKKKCIVFYGSSVRDSVLAWSFITSAQAKGIRILLKQEVFKEELNKITQVLASPTEYDEWKAPVQFTIPKDSLGAIFVASEDPLMYTKVVSAVETRKDNTLIIGSENWIDQSTIEMAKFQHMNFVFYAPNFVSSNSEHYASFTQAFINKHGRAPSGLTLNYARIGYELMMVFGQALNRYGVNFEVGLKTEQQPSYLFQGVDFRNSRSNLVVPFVRFSNGSLEVVANH